jgi:hypothetical protein
VNDSAKLALVIASAVLAGPAYAQGSTSAGSAQAESKGPDPSEMVCERLQLVGSRLATKKICMTRSQWADSRRQDRQAVEKAQASPCVITQTGAGGRPSC